MVFADYLDTTIGPYREVVVLISAEREGTPGMFCPLIYVDSDAALCAGREIWGFPKKLADIEFEQEGDEVRARLVRAGIELLSLSGSIEERVDPTAFAALGALPIYNRKLIPGVAAKEADVDHLTQVHLEIVTHEATTGTGLLQAAGEAATVVGELTKITMVTTVVDSVLPAGEDLADPSDRSLASEVRARFRTWAAPPQGSSSEYPSTIERAAIRPRNSLTPSSISEARASRKYFSTGSSVERPMPPST